MAKRSHTYITEHWWILKTANASANKKQMKRYFAADDSVMMSQSDAKDQNNATNCNRHRNIVIIVAQKEIKKYFMNTEEKSNCKILFYFSFAASLVEPIPHLK